MHEKLTSAIPEGREHWRLAEFITGVEGDEGLEVEGWLQGLTADASSS